MLQKIVCFLVLHSFLATAEVIVQRSSGARLEINPPQLFMQAFVGESVNLVCTAVDKDGGTFSDLKWWNPKREIIAEGNPGVIKLSKNSLMLVLADQTVKDSGVYKCTATYEDAAYLEAEVSILFYESIQFENCSVNQVLYCNEEGEISCNPISGKQVSITWTKDNKKLDSGRFTLLSSGILINHVIEEDAGLYIIEAFEPTTGTFKTREITVDVLSRDSENTTGAVKSVSVKKVTKNAVVFDITVSESVKSIEGHYKEVLSEAEDMVSWNIDDTFEVGNLTPSGRYQFRFRAKPSPSARWYKLAEVTLLPEAPEVIFRYPRNGTLIIEWVSTTEDTRRGTIDKYLLSYGPIEAFDNGWEKCNSTTNIEIPSCVGAKYELVSLKQGTAYEVSLAAHTSAGFGDAYSQKVQV